MFAALKEARHICQLVATGKSLRGRNKMLQLQTNMHRLIESRQSIRVQVRDVKSFERVLYVSN